VRRRSTPKATPKETPKAAVKKAATPATKHRRSVAVTPMTPASPGSPGRRVARWPDGKWKRALEKDAEMARDRGGGPDARSRLALRDVALTLRHGAQHGTTVKFTTAHPSLRPMPVPHPFRPDELALFDTHVRFVTAAPGGLVKPDAAELVSDEQKKPFADANAARMQELVDANGADALFLFTDGARQEGDHAEHRGEACAGAFVVCVGADPKAAGALRHQAQVPVAALACVYTAELCMIHDAFEYVIDNRATLFAGVADPKLVLVTDSKSSLESLRTTWLRRIGRKEQIVARQLFDLAALGVRTTLAFVFSHVGGAPGNAYVDDLATEACEDAGDAPDDDLWQVDTTRRMLLDRHNAIDSDVGRLVEPGEKVAGKARAFRFRHVPYLTYYRPSQRLPREMPRDAEVALYRARLGMLPAAGGVLHGFVELCPLCGHVDVIGRHGRTMEHLAKCLPAHSGGLLHLDIDTFWADPQLAVVQLAKATEYIAEVQRARGPQQPAAAAEPSSEPAPDSTPTNTSRSKRVLNKEKQTRGRNTKSI
jgi:hypothetical protein